MRAMILRELLSKPMNANQLSGKFGVDYKTVVHHIEVLLKMNWITRSMEKYGELFFPAFTEEEKEVFWRISAKVGKKL